MNGKGLYPTLKLIFIELITLYRQNCTDVQDLYTLKKLFSPQFEYVEEKLLGRNFPLKKWWCKTHRRPWSVAYNRPHIFCNKNNRCDLCIGPPILPGKLNTSLSSPIFNIKEYNIQLKKYKRKWKNLIYYENIIKTQTKTKITRPLSTNSKRKVSMFGSILFLNIFYFISKSLILKKKLYFYKQQYPLFFNAALETVWKTYGYHGWWCTSMDFCINHCCPSHACCKRTENKCSDCKGPDPFGSHKKSPKISLYIPDTYRKIKNKKINQIVENVKYISNICD